MSKVTDPNFNPSGNPTITFIKEQVNIIADEISTWPDGRRKSIALTKLEDFSMWAVKAAAVGDS